MERFNTHGPLLFFPPTDLLAPSRSKFEIRVAQKCTRVA